VPPIYLILSFVGVKGLKMGTDQRAMAAYNNKGIDRDVLLIPEVYCESYPSIHEDAASLLRPAFDTVWNSAGWPRSINYAEDGTWKPPR
jgi:hypothetical protein